LQTAPGRCSYPEDRTLTKKKKEGTRHPRKRSRETAETGLRVCTLQREGQREYDGVMRKSGGKERTPWEFEGRTHQRPAKKGGCIGYWGKREKKMRERGPVLKKKESVVVGQGLSKEIGGVHGAGRNIVKK